MKKIITPGILFLAMVVSSACAETEDTVDPDPNDEQPTETETEPVPCCAPDSPRGNELLFDSFDLGRRARERLDFLRRMSSN